MLFNFSIKIIHYTLGVWTGSMYVHLFHNFYIHYSVVASSTPGYALQVGTQRKLSSHLSASSSIGTDFVPIVAETLGGLSEDSTNMVRSLGKSIAQRANPQDPFACTSQLFHRLAITLWRGNATL